MRHSPRASRPIRTLALGGKTMDLSSLQRRIDAVTWYHEFDFGNGLRARSTTTDDREHRRIWRFIEENLERIDFCGKTVLDVGCWDGYWSFYAERRGAKSVLASDDCSQNWAAGQGIHLARELLGSSIQIDQNLSVYDLASLGRQFDVILFLGVFYHLLDPFYALAQIRRCCHPETVVLMEGSVATELRANEALYDFSNRTCEFLPHPDAYCQLVRAAYFEETGRAFLAPPEPPAPPPPGRLGWRWRLGTCLSALKGSRSELNARLSAVAPPDPPQTSYRRTFLTCKPFEGVNALHAYVPPFGLDAYDPRFRPAAVRKGA